MLMHNSNFGGKTKMPRSFSEDLRWNNLELFHTEKDDKKDKYGVLCEY